MQLRDMNAHDKPGGVFVARGRGRSRLSATRDEGIKPVGNRSAFLQCLFTVWRFIQAEFD